MKLPYGIADFYALITGGYHYVDRTSHIRDLEEFGPALVFIRPRRFGKSLWLRTLACYYDLRFEDEFGLLFGNLAIGREPTPLKNRYFVLEWDFSLVEPRGSVDDIARHLREHVNARVETFLTRYRDRLPGAVNIADNPAVTLERLLAAVEQTPYKLYLLIDEYDNFINEVMTKDTAVYRALVYQDGPFKQIFKAVKSAAAGRGLERVFLTGVSPVALNDVSSGFNIARDVYLEPELATLCGFTELEIRDQILRPLIDEQDLPATRAAEALDTMRTWYNGYRFSENAPTPVYNPTNVLYFLGHLQRRGTAPPELHDRNLALDQGKLAFLSGTPAGGRVIAELARGDGTIEVPALEKSFSMEDLVKKLEVDERFVASFLYYLGLLTHAGGVRLGIPNLVVRKLYLERLLELCLPAAEDLNLVRRIALDFYRRGELEPLLDLVESKLLPVLSNRDARHLHRGEEDRSGGEMTLKSLFLSLLLDDQLYAPLSELEIAKKYSDLFLFVRPHRRGEEFLDLLFEVKYVPRKQLGKSADVRGLDEEDLRRLPPVRTALERARDQVRDYGKKIRDRFGPGLRLRGYSVVALGMERLVGEEVPLRS